MLPYIVYILVYVKMLNRVNEMAEIYGKKMRVWESEHARKCLQEFHVDVY